MPLYLVFALSMMLGSTWYMMTSTPRADWNYANQNMGWRELVPPVVKPEPGKKAIVYGVDLRGVERSHLEVLIPCAAPMIRGNELYVIGARSSYGPYVTYQAGCVTYAEIKK